MQMRNNFENEKTTFAIYNIQTYLQTPSRQA